VKKEPDKKDKPKEPHMLSHENSTSNESVAELKEPKKAISRPYEVQKVNLSDSIALSIEQHKLRVAQTHMERIKEIIKRDLTFKELLVNAKEGNEEREGYSRYQELYDRYKDIYKGLFTKERVEITIAPEVIDKDIEWAKKLLEDKSTASELENHKSKMRRRNEQYALIAAIKRQVLGSDAHRTVKWDSKSADQLTDLFGTLERAEQIRALEGEAKLDVIRTLKLQIEQLGKMQERIAHHYAYCTEILKRTSDAQKLESLILRFGSTAKMQQEACTEEALKEIQKAKAEKEKEKEREREREMIAKRLSIQQLKGLLSPNSTGSLQRVKNEGNRGYFQRYNEEASDIMAIFTPPTIDETQKPQLQQDEGEIEDGGDDKDTGDDNEQNSEDTGDEEGSEKELQEDEEANPSNQEKTTTPKKGGEPNSALAKLRQTELEQAKKKRRRRRKKEQEEIRRTTSPVEQNQNTRTHDEDADREAKIQTTGSQKIWKKTREAKTEHNGGEGDGIDRLDGQRPGGDHNAGRADRHHQEHRRGRRVLATGGEFLAQTDKQHRSERRGRRDPGGRRKSDNDLKRKIFTMWSFLWGSVCLCNGFCLFYK